MLPLSGGRGAAAGLRRSRCRRAGGDFGAGGGRGGRGAGVPGGAQGRRGSSAGVGRSGPAWRSTCTTRPRCGGRGRGSRRSSVPLRWSRPSCRRWRRPAPSCGSPSSRIPPSARSLTFGLGGVLADAIGDRVPRLVPFSAGRGGRRRSQRRGPDGRWAATSAPSSGVIDMLERVACLADDHPELDAPRHQPGPGVDGGGLGGGRDRARPACSRPRRSRASPRLTSPSCPRTPGEPSSSRPAWSSNCARSSPATCVALVTAADGVGPGRPDGATCCGQPAWNAGFAAAAVAAWPARRCGRCAVRTGPSSCRRVRCATMMQRALAGAVRRHRARGRGSAPWPAVWSSCRPTSTGGDGRRGRQPASGRGDRARQLPRPAGAGRQGAAPVAFSPTRGWRSSRPQGPSAAAGSAGPSA